MSHFHERTDKSCLNCGATVQGRYCQNCGQENIEPKQSFWHLVVHFFEDITHFDGKFFSSLKYLIKKPGFLSEAYVEGRRASYLNPIRMYIFTSAVFFFLIFSLRSHEPDLVLNANGRNYEIREIEKMDSLQFDQFTRKINKENKVGDLPMTREQFKVYYDSVISPTKIFQIRYTSIEAYDSAVALGKEKKLGWLERKWKIRKIELSHKYGSNSLLFFKAVEEKFIHYLPQLLFISLPFFGLILLLLYARQKNFYYVDHFIFGLHTYIFLFIILFIVFLFNKLERAFSLPGKVIVNLLTFGTYWIYMILAMRRFYKQNWGKTIIKFICLEILFYILLIFLFVLFFFISLLLI